MKAPRIKASKKAANPFQTSQCVRDFAGWKDDDSDPRANDAFESCPKELRVGQQLPLVLPTRTAHGNRTLTL